MPPAINVNQPQQPGDRFPPTGPNGAQAWPGQPAPYGGPPATGGQPGYGAAGYGPPGHPQPGPGSGGFPPAGAGAPMTSNAPNGPMRTGAAGGGAMSGRGRGTPKIVPIVMSAGLAVGTFAGLWVGVGPAKTVVAEAGPAGRLRSDPVAGVDPNNVGGTAPLTPQVATAPPDAPPAVLPAVQVDAAPVAVDAMPHDAGAAVAAVVPVDAAPAAPSAPDAAPPPPPTPAVVQVKVAFTVEPADAQIKVDGKKLDGTTLDVALPADGGARTVAVEVSASGYVTQKKKVKIEASQQLEFKLAKKRSGGGRNTGGGGGGSGGGGLIDL